ncbi:Wadjet anti-phage system protein JetD domain-containing protein [Pseudomonas aeruginosa]|uniref:Wadjet anti-phage system protein JetD domain-containing protein n=1 Tax=Pseudomonas aeruginosa TaxID=287 RepID=UPI001A2D2488|nr:Wadjet anti-phage system protein JetD domain-containing protein [Pseudomonas aeruginosa]ELP1401952.1 hypothetical protein [Pseudomonas aeruginosa]MBG6257826.1 hypothetical protein [Pseudomonas aeruginosa]MBY1012111.1 hypothetical protein [Pseudomonas aeruginosa]MCT4830580.1 DUF2220 domain-containing protein [Pseudomonas aeruginosa]MCV3976695.1 DUF2220 domain-containing protein [Pseudomonas aeruginosa]
MSSVIYSYLSKIQSRQPVNFDALIAKLLAAGVVREDISRIFFAKKLKKNSYSVNVLVSASFDELLVRFKPSDVGGRVGAAIDGNSHRARVSESLLMFRSAQHRHPVVAVTETGAWVLPRHFGKVGVIVENLESFLQVDETLSFVAGILAGATGEIELIFGSGNQVTNRLNARILSQFDELYCLFDVDMGGLRMFASLTALLHEKKPVFLYPPDVQGRLAKSKYALADQHRQEVIKYQGLSPETDKLIQLMRDSSRVLEQETYLVPVVLEDRP